MILIGQYDSPFVRRVAIALRLYGMPYEHRPWSVFRDGELIAPFNPLRRVPTLVLDDGTALIESFVILDYLDGLAGPERALVPAAGDARRDALRIAALGTGLADKAVSLVYEKLLHDQVSDDWASRSTRQIGSVLEVLERDRAPRLTPYWFGERIGHADIAVTCALRFVSEAHPDVFAAAQCPALKEHAAQCEALPIFQEILQPLVIPR